MTGDYDIQTIIESMEDELIASYRRNLARHTAEEIKEGFEWPMWQILKLKDLRSFDRKAAGIVKKYGSKANREAQNAVEEEFRGGALHADELLHKYGIDVDDINDGSFFKANQYQAAALKQAIHDDFKNAGNAVLRMSDDIYRQTVFKAQMFYTSGVSSLWKAVDMANKSFLDRGYSCIEYKNGSRVNAASYVEMCLRTSKKKANMAGEGRRAAEYGVTLCQVTQYSACSPTCLPWQGKIYVDDVYAGGSPDGKHPLLSEAIAGGLFHPNCRHGKQPYFEGISRQLQPMNEPEIGENYEAEQRQREIERNIRKFKRRAEGSLDRENQIKALNKMNLWRDELRRHLNSNPQLRENMAREQISDFGRAWAGHAISVRNQIAKHENTVGTITSNGIKITSLSEHFGERAVERNVRQEYVQKTLTRPLKVDKIKIDGSGRRSMRFIGERATVNINPETGVIVTAWKTGEKLAAKLKKDGEKN